MSETRQWGGWTTFTELNDVMTYRQVLAHILATAPPEVLDSQVREWDKKMHSPIAFYRKNPTASYDDPLAQNGFVSWKITYDSDS